MLAGCFTLTIHIVNGNLLVGIILRNHLGIRRLTWAWKTFLFSPLQLPAASSCSTWTVCYTIMHNTMDSWLSHHKHNVLLTPCDNLNHFNSIFFPRGGWRHPFPDNHLKIRASSCLHPSVLFIYFQPYCPPEILALLALNSKVIIYFYLAISKRLHRGRLSNAGWKLEVFLHFKFCHNRFENCPQTLSTSCR